MHFRRGGLAVKQLFGYVAVSKKTSDDSLYRAFKSPTAGCLLAKCPNTRGDGRVAHLVERRTQDPKDRGSNPVRLAVGVPNTRVYWHA